MKDFGLRYWSIIGLSWSFLYFGLGLTSGTSGALGVLSGTIVYWLDAYLFWSSRKDVIDDNFQIATAYGFKVLHIARENGLRLYQLEKNVSPSINGHETRPIVISMYIRTGGVSVHYRLTRTTLNGRGDTVHLTTGPDYCLSPDDIDRIEQHAIEEIAYLPEAFSVQMTQS